jgi:hypothetical protein
MSAFASKADIALSNATHFLGVTFVSVNFASQTCVLRKLGLDLDQ